ncbi:MAG: biotin--[acetyl-CoA-carboxylase] ligase [Deferrisomatales bacterium]|nr:biotin--[acetyl-CoA-carboxylase] ligase [Deferrisomatales bacterium]
MPSCLPDAVLERLCGTAGQAVSGQVLARDLGVTRAAIWKGIEQLRGVGYPVESLQGRGYRLATRPGGVRPGEVAGALRTRTLGRALRHLESVDSTNREAERWALDGAPEGAAVVAEHQGAGRGRLGRHWHDRPGESLLLSVVLRPPTPSASAPLLTFVAAVALAETCAHWVPAERVAIKWPNDVLVGGRKMAGILLELRAEGQRVEHVVLGVGVNVGGAVTDLPPELRVSAGTLAEAVGEMPAPTRLDTLCRFLERLEAGYDAFCAVGPGSVTEPWNRWFRMAGERIAVHTPGGRLEGVALGLGPAGQLRLDDGTGTAVEIYAGDVEWSSTRCQGEAP